MSTSTLIQPDDIAAAEPRWRYAIMWAVLCAVGGGPGFYIALGQGYDWRAMCLGAAVYLFGGVALARMKAFARLETRPFLGRSLVVAFLLFLIGSLFTGFFLHIAVGLASVRVVEIVVGRSGTTFEETLAITLIHAAVFSAIVLAIALAVYGWQRIALKAPEREGFCRKCGNDLRASPERCPECGEPHTWRPRGSFEYRVASNELKEDT